MKIYIAGKITGLPYEEANRLFSRADAYLKLKGHEVVNPMKLHGGRTDLTWRQYMITCIKHLVECDGLYLLPNWPMSKGAKIERRIAYDLGLDIMYPDLMNEPWA